MVVNEGEGSGRKGKGAKKGRFGLRRVYTAVFRMKESALLSLANLLSEKNSSMRKLKGQVYLDVYPNPSAEGLMNWYLRSGAQLYLEFRVTKLVGNFDVPLKKRQCLQILSGLECLVSRRPTRTF